MEPATPLGPVGLVLEAPVAPVAPVDPGGPTTERPKLPGGPVYPVGPVCDAPVGPATVEGAPVGPVAPVSPGMVESLPVGPVAPKFAAEPGGPVGPVIVARYPHGAGTAPTNTGSTYTLIFLYSYPRT